MMVPLLLHEPPRPFGASHSTWMAPLLTCSRFSLPSAKNAREWLSGDQKADIVSSVPATTRGVSASRLRIHNCLLPLTSAATNASCLPSGETLMEGEATVACRETNVVPDAGSTENRPVSAESAGRRCIPFHSASAAIDNRTAAVTAQVRQENRMICRAGFAFVDASATQRSAINKSRAACQRSSGSFARQTRMA